MKGRRIAFKRPIERSDGDAVTIVGTYKDKQLAWIKRYGVYNYPVKEEDELKPESCAKVKELWLYASAKGKRHCFAAEFAGIQSKDQFLAANPTYKNLGPCKHARYMVFKTTVLDYGPRLVGATVFARVSDFEKGRGRTKKIAAAIKQFHADGDFGLLADYLPNDLAKLPREQLRVCEAAVQLDFLPALQSPIVPHLDSVDFFGDLRNKSIADSLRLKPLSGPNGFTHVDCFSGVGGFCTGLHAAGFTTLVAIEKIKSCVETYQANHPDVHVINNDICKVMAKDVIPHCPNGGVDLVTSGMPCETFSTAGNTSRSFYDERQFLFREGIRIANITNAKFLLFENVPAITTKTVSKTSRELIIDVLKDELIKAGYKNFIEIVLDSTRYGVPQRRKRYFVLGTRLENVNLQKPITNFTKPFTVGEAFSDLPPVEPNTWREGTEYTGTTNPFVELMRDDAFWRRKDLAVPHLTYQMPMKHRPATLERFSLLKPGEGLRELFEKHHGKERAELQSRHVLPRKMFIKRNYRLPKGQPSPTVTSHCLDEFVHPVENRALTVRECARLQSFPDSYNFIGGPYIVPHIDREVQDKYEQIGDAVPPLLAYAWGRVIGEMLEECK